MVTVCQPAAYGYGHGYGHNYCKEVAQETCYNVPVLTVVEPEVQVIHQTIRSNDKLFFRLLKTSVMKTNAFMDSGSIGKC